MLTMTRFPEEIEEQQESKNATSFKHCTKDFSALDYAALDNTQMKERACALQDDLLSLRAIISFITRRLACASHLLEFKLVTALYDNWLSSVAEVVEGAWLSPTADDNALEELFITLGLPFERQPIAVHFSALEESYRGKNLKDMIQPLFATAEDARQRAIEAHRYLVESSIVPQYCPPDYILDCTTPESAAAARRLRPDFVSCLGDLAEVGRYMTSAVQNIFELNDVQRREVGQFGEIDTNLRRAQSESRALELRKRAMELTNTCYNLDSERAQVMLQRLQLDMRDMEIEKSMLVVKYVLEGSEHKLGHFDSTFDILQAGGKPFNS